MTRAPLLRGALALGAVALVATGVTPSHAAVPRRPPAAAIAAAYPAAAVSVSGGDAQPSALQAAITRYAATRRGTVTVAVLDRRTQVETVVHPGHRMHTASIVKVDILETRLHQSHGRMSAGQRRLAVRMIEDSDNEAADDLWEDDGGRSGVSAYDGSATLTQTAPQRQWGLTTTSATDQVALVRLLVRPNPLLSDAARRYERHLMHRVTPSQHWGISAGPGAGVTVGLKNGWLPVATDHYRWAVNSIGWVHGDGRSYLIAVLTQHNPSMGYGIDTIEHISRQVWARLGS